MCVPPRRVPKKVYSARGARKMLPVLGGPNFDFSVAGPISFIPVLMPPGEVGFNWANTLVECSSWLFSFWFPGVGEVIARIWTTQVEFGVHGYRPEEVEDVIRDTGCIVNLPPMLISKQEIDLL